MIADLANEGERVMLKRRETQESLLLHRRGTQDTLDTEAVGFNSSHPKRSHSQLHA
jgi:hypothetical protein